MNWVWDVIVFFGPYSPIGPVLSGALTWAVLVGVYSYFLFRYWDR